jgi:DNA-binding LytR/AlgR family response regulator
MKYQSKVTDYVLNGNNQYTADSTEVNHELHPTLAAGKKSFLVFKHNKYLVIPTERIALFYIKYDSTVIVTFDKQEHSVNYSLEQVQQLLPPYQFFRLNRQYLINANAIKEAEHYFARKLLVTPTLPFPDKLIVSKEKARNFLDWLESR